MYHSVILEEILSWDVRAGGSHADGECRVHSPLLSSISLPLGAAVFFKLITYSPWRTLPVVLDP